MGARPGSGALCSLAAAERQTILGLHCWPVPGLMFVVVRRAGWPHVVFTGREYPRARHKPAQGTWHSKSRLDADTTHLLAVEDVGAIDKPNEPALTGHDKRMRADASAEEAHAAQHIAVGHGGSYENHLLPAG